MSPTATVRCLCSWVSFLSFHSIGFPMSHAFANPKQRKTGPSKAATEKTQARGGGFGGGGVGFGAPAKTSKAKNKAMPPPPGYRRDTFPSTMEFIDFLLDEECEGIAKKTDDESVEGGVEIGYSLTTPTGMRGLYARDNFQAGEFLCAIPFLTTLVVQDDQVGENSTTNDAERGLLFLQNYIDVMPEKWKPYLQCLPQPDDHGMGGLFDPTPDFFSTEDMDALELPLVIDAARKRKEEIQTLVAEQQQKGVVVDRNALQFATWLVKSRSFSVIRLKPDPLDASKKTIYTRSVMIPLLDMINHASNNNPNAELQVIETKADEESFYALQATRPIAAKEEITISYGTGQESSVELFLNYGFVPDQNSHDVAFLRSESEKDNNTNGLTHSDKWTTTLEEDEDLKKAAPVGSTFRRILDFRIQMKRAQKEV
jgi:hypothetical protein